MSIYSTTLDFDSDDHDLKCARWVRCNCEDKSNHGHFSVADGKHWRHDETKDCTCKAGPLVYRRSHVLPSDDDPRGGTFSLGAIPGFVGRPGRGPLNENGYGDPYWPWLRVSVNSETVVLTREQVEEVAGELARWLEWTEE